MLTFTIHNLRNITLFRCQGRITAGQGSVLRDGVPTHADHGTVILDLAEISAVDAAGLGVLVYLLTWSDATGRRLKLLNLTPRVEDLLKLTRLRSAFEVCSVRDMMDLLCDLNDQGSLPKRAAVPAYLVAPPIANELPRSLDRS
jgi:anti-sigma B factor antagonist